MRDEQICSYLTEHRHDCSAEQRHDENTIVAPTIDDVISEIAWSLCVTFLVVMVPKPRLSSSNDDDSSNSCSRKYSDGTLRRSDCFVKIATNTSYDGTADGQESRWLGTKTGRSDTDRCGTERIA